MIAPPPSRRDGPRGRATDPSTAAYHAGETRRTRAEAELAQTPSVHKGKVGGCLGYVLSAKVFTSESLSAVLLERVP